MISVALRIDLVGKQSKIKGRGTPMPTHCCRLLTAEDASYDPSAKDSRSHACSDCLPSENMPDVDATRQVTTVSPSLVLVRSGMARLGSLVLSGC